MTHEDYELVAKAVKQELEFAATHHSSPVAMGSVASTAYRLANAFASDSPAFNRDKFLAACGVNS